MKVSIYLLLLLSSRFLCSMSHFFLAIRYIYGLSVLFSSFFMPRLSSCRKCPVSEPSDSDLRLIDHGDCWSALSSSGERPSPITHAQKRRPFAFLKRTLSVCRLRRSLIALEEIYQRIETGENMGVRFLLR